MRRLPQLLVALALVALSATAMQAPADTHAAPHRAAQTTLTGKLVAAPAVTTRSARTNLLIQVSARTVLVRVASGTPLVNRDFARITLGALRYGAMLQVTGRYRGGWIAASMIRDLSLPVPIIHVKGQLAAAPNPATPPSSGLLCLARTVTGGASVQGLQTAAPCPAGQLPIYLTSSTRIVDQFGKAANPSDLQAGDTLTVTASLSNGRLMASQIKDLSLPPPTVQVKGQLAASPNVAAGSLCLGNAAVTGGSLPRAQAQIASPCAAGQLPIYVTTSTKIQDRSAGAASMAELRVGDTLQVTASLIKGRLTASMVKDLSIPAGITTLSGTLVAIPAVATSSAPTTLLLQAGDRTIQVRISSRTLVVNSNSVRIGLGDLRDGAQLQVMGRYNGVSITALLIRDLSL
jgi:hypothetical protein